MCAGCFCRTAFPGSALQACTFWGSLTVSQYVEEREPSVPPPPARVLDLSQEMRNMPIICQKWKNAVAGPGTIHENRSKLLNSPGGEGHFSVPSSSQTISVSSVPKNDLVISLCRDQLVMKLPKNWPTWGFLKFHLSGRLISCHS